MPFGSYQESPEQALRNAVRLMQAGAHMVKVEGGGWTVPSCAHWSSAAFPVCGHLDSRRSRYTCWAAIAFRAARRRGAAMRAQAKELAEAGADMLVLELMPAAVALAADPAN